MVPTSAAKWTRIQSRHLCRLGIDRLPGLDILESLDDHPVGCVQSFFNHPIRPDPIAGLHVSEGDFIVGTHESELEPALQFLDSALRNQQGVFLH